MRTFALPIKYHQISLFNFWNISSKLCFNAFPSRATFCSLINQKPSVNQSQMVLSYRNNFGLLLLGFHSLSTMYSRLLICILIQFIFFVFELLCIGFSNSLKWKENYYQKNLPLLSTNAICHSVRLISIFLYRCRGKSA